MQLAEYSLEGLRDDGEFILYRAHEKQVDQPSVLLLAHASTRPSPGTLKKLDHEYALKSELDSAWAVGPLALSERSGQMTLVLEDPGCETLDRFISGAMELTQFLRFGIGLATAIGGLHEKKLIHKDVKSWIQGSYNRSRAEYHMQLLVPSLTGNPACDPPLFRLTNCGGFTTPIPRAQRNLIATEGVSCLCPQVHS